MQNRAPEYGLEFLLTFDDRIHHLDDDFFDEVQRVLGEREVGTTVVAVEETRRSK